MAKPINIFAPARASTPRPLLAWVLQVLLAAVFLSAGSAKLIGLEAMVALFAQIGLRQWFRFLTGALEVVGGLLLLSAGAAFWGAGLLAWVMVGAILTHLFIIGGSAIPASVLLLLTLAMAWLRRPRDT